MRLKELWLFGNTVCILLLSSITFVSAQSFGTPSSVWTYDLESFGKQVVEYDKDTILMDKNYSRYSITRYYHMSMDTTIQERPPIYINNSDGLITFTDDLVVYDTMINYSASLGDSWVLVGEEVDTFDVVVLDTFTSQINGQSLFTYTSEFIRRRNGSFLVDTIYERIGSTKNFIIPYQGWGFLGGFTGGHLRCYFDDELGYVNFETSRDATSHFQLDCSNSVSTQETDQDHSYNIYPNPIIDQLCLETKDNLPVSLQVYDPSGLLVSKSRTDLGLNCLDLSHLEAGLYFVRLGDRVEKFVKL